jgi:hypothetical protein
MTANLAELAHARACITRRAKLRRTGATDPTRVVPC